MKKNKFDKKTLFLGIGLTISTIVLFLFLAYRMYCYFKGEKIDDTYGYNSINAVVAIMALIMNILTVIFVFVTYQAQRETIRMQARQIASDKKDGDFNRVMDVIYRQLEHTNKRFDDEIMSLSPYVKNSLRVMYGGSLKYISIERTPKITDDDQSFIYDSSKVLFFFSKELEVYYKIINTNNHLSKDDKDFFTKLYADNIDSSLLNQIGLFQNWYCEFKKSEWYKVANKGKTNTTLNNIEYDLTIVLGYLRISKIEGLDLG